MKRFKSVFTVSNNRLMGDRDGLQNAIKTFEGKYVELELRDVTRIRTTKQNAYYWGVVIPLCAQGFKDATGETWSANIIHESLINKFSVKQYAVINENTGEHTLFDVPMRTSQMDTEQFSEYIDQIRTFASEYLNIEIPEPKNQSIEL